MNTISAVVISKNEEKNIARCIQSLQQVADEIIIIDSFSTDRTKEICLLFDVRFVERQWQGYSQTKNYGNNIAQHQFILSLDADEVLDREAVQSILEFKNLAHSHYAYSLNRKNFYGQKWIKYCGWYPDKKIRLFDKNVAFWQGDFVHETLVVKSDKTEHLAGNILHFTISDEKHHLQTIEKYAKLAAQMAVSKNQKLTPLPSLLSGFGRFFKIFVLKLGLLHGSVGFKIAFNSAKSRWLRYRFFKQLTSKS
ncbi:MAG: glycosyltransferase family 2 protein [Bacteroidia bacterium]